MYMYSPNELLSFSCKIAGFTKATFISSMCLCCCCYCIGQHSSFSEKKKKGKIAFFFSYKCLPNQCKTDRFQQNFPRKLPQNHHFCQSFFSKICRENSREFPAKSAIFFCEFVSRNPTKFDFFRRPIRTPVMIIML